MEIKEFYKCEGFYEDFKCVDGRWKWKSNIDEVTLKMDNQPKLEFTDCFGNHDKIIFNFNQPPDTEHIITVLPLNSRFMLLECRDELDDDLRVEMDPTKSWSILELDWSTKTCKTGTEKFTCELMNRFSPRAGYPKINRAFSNSKDEDLYFLIYKKDENGTHFNCIHCKINARNLKFQQLGSNFQIPIDLFNCIDLNGHLISGLSTSLDAITHFDLNSRQLLDSAKQVQGLPHSICLDFGNNHGFRYLPAVGVWTSKNLYLWSEEKQSEKDETYLSYIYVVYLETGVAQKLEFPFNGQIRQLFSCVDNYLIVRFDTFIRNQDYKGPAWDSCMYGKKPFLAFQLSCLRIENSESLASTGILSNPWQVEAKQILKLTPDEVKE